MTVSARMLRAVVMGPAVLLSCWVALVITALLPELWSGLYALAVALLVVVLAAGVGDPRLGRRRPARRAG